MRKPAGVDPLGWRVDFADSNHAVTDAPKQLVDDTHVVFGSEDESLASGPLSERRAEEPIAANEFQDHALSGIFGN